MTRAGHNVLVLPASYAGPLMAGARAAGLIGAVGLAVQLVLASQARWLERLLDRGAMALWHRKAGPVLALLLLAHPLLILASRAAKAPTPLSDLLALVWGWQDVPAAAAGLLLILCAALSCWSPLRRRLSPGAWRILHRMVYPGAALCLPHQFVLGRQLQVLPLAALAAAAYALAVVSLAWYRWLPRAYLALARMR